MTKFGWAVRPVGEQVMSLAHIKIGYKEMIMEARPFLTFMIFISRDPKILPRRRSSASALFFSRISWRWPSARFAILFWRVARGRRARKYRLLTFWPPFWPPSATVEAKENIKNSKKKLTLENFDVADFFCVGRDNGWKCRDRQNSLSCVDWWSFSENGALEICIRPHEVWVHFGPNKIIKNETSNVPQL